MPCLLSPEVGEEYLAVDPPAFALSDKHKEVGVAGAAPVERFEAGHDYLLEVTVPDLDAYQQFLVGKLLNLPLVREVRSNIAIQTLKAGAPLPLGHLRSPSETSLVGFGRPKERKK